jgi:hypothetical protein
MTTKNSPVEIQFRLHAMGRPQEGSGLANTTRSGSGRVPRVTQVMALAIQFQDMIQRCEARDYADLARLGCLTRERISQIMELVWLAPDIQRHILYLPPTSAGRYPISERAVRKIANHLVWEDQRSEWDGLAKDVLGASGRM